MFVVLRGACRERVVNVARAHLEFTGQGPYSVKPGRTLSAPALVKVEAAHDLPPTLPLPTLADGQVLSAAIQTCAIKWEGGFAEVVRHLRCRVKTCAARCAFVQGLGFTACAYVGILRGKVAGTLRRHSYIAICFSCLATFARA